MSKGTDFFDAIENAQRLVASEPASLFQALAPQKKAPEQNILSQEAIDWDYQCEIYLIHRPWHNCGRCTDDIQGNKVELPEDGDITCPHTRKKNYLQTMQKILNEGWLQVKRDEQFLQNGSVQVMVAWLVPKPNKEKAKKLAEKTFANTSED